MRGADPSDIAFAVFAVALVLGMGLIWLPLGILAVALVGLILSVALARSDGASGG